ncbi:hypothetical protein J1N35_037485 [Gossypium stocksii]|uniref:Uncharacterized protein n=1 Tax=Gossypium stocksii TaxID=47602 RepID=A0A9D3UJS6_9ROSI|nr:hypothetical protein J1N35_037485 [Gossypium stocksii]
MGDHLAHKNWPKLADLGEFGQTDHLRPHGSQDERSSPVKSGIRAIGSKALLECQKESSNKGKLEESMEDTEEDSVQELLDSQRKKLTERNDAFKAMVIAMKEETIATKMALSIRIGELEGELALCE